MFKKDVVVGEEYILFGMEKQERVKCVSLEAYFTHCVKVRGGRGTPFEIDSSHLIPDPVSLKAPYTDILSFYNATGEYPSCLVYIEAVRNNRYSGARRTPASHYVIHSFNKDLVYFFGRDGVLLRNAISFHPLVAIKIQEFGDLCTLQSFLAANKDHAYFV